MSQDHLQGAIALPHIQPRALREQRMLHLRKLEFQVRRSFLFLSSLFFFCLGCLWHHMYVSVESYDRILEKEVFFWYGFGPLWMDVFNAFQWPLSGYWPFLRPSSQYPVKISM